MDQPSTQSGETTLDLGHCKVEWFHKYEDEDVWGGTVHFFGFPHHFIAIKVKQVELIGGLEWISTDDPENRIEDYYRMYEYPPMPAKIPGLEGDFVILIHPHGD